MTPYYADESVTVLSGDCLDVLPTLADASVDAVVCDPPYGLGFMGKTWDSPAGTGDFPMRRSAELDAVNGGASRQGGRQRNCEDYARRQARDARTYGEWCERWAAECLRVLKPGGHLLAFGGTRTYHRIACAVEDVGFEVRDSIAWLYGSGFPKSLNIGDGQGTALKPAHEPIVVARKSTIGTVAANVLTHGTGALNIDGCRVPAEGESLDGGRVSSTSPGWDRAWKHDEQARAAAFERGAANVARAESLGRWPANVVLDESQAAALDEQTGVLASGWRDTDTAGNQSGATDLGKRAATREYTFGHYADSGGASRFFPTFRYEAKAPTSERPAVDGTLHPTVKPLDLMRWLVRLVTPRGGTVLDPFLGSGTTAEACVLEHLRCIGIEREADYLPLIAARLTKPLAVGFDFGEVPA